MGPARVGVLALALPLLVATACDRAGEESEARATEAPDRPRLELTVAPRTGDAPFAVHLEVRLLGATDGDPSLRCPSLAWDLGNADVLIARAGDCAAGDPPRIFEVDYTYRSAGAFYASARVLASDVEASSPVQVLVRGATPTPPVVAAAPGPTIIIATPATTRVALVAPSPAPAGGTPRRTPRAAATAIRTTASVVPARVTAAMPPTPGGSMTAPSSPLPTGAMPAATGPTTTGAMPAATAPLPTGAIPAATPEPTVRPPATRVPPAAAASRVLPADLYYLDGAGMLWRLPASGGAPRPVDGVEAPVYTFQVSATGSVAYTRGGALRLVAAGLASRELAAAPASDPVWSRDGRRLAYAMDGVRVYDVSRDDTALVTGAGTPLAWSPDGDRLLIRDADGQALAVDLASGTRVALPIGVVSEAGWLPDRDVAWLAGPGLRLVSFDGPLTVLTAIDPGVAVGDGFVRPDLRLLALRQEGASSRAVGVDLTATSVAADPIGPVLDLGGADFAWAPDGRTAAVAGPGGLDVVDVTTGARVPLVTDPARRPQWVLTGR
jgi:hypothetical protein